MKNVKFLLFLFPILFTQRANSRIIGRAMTLSHLKETKTKEPTRSAIDLNSKVTHKNASYQLADYDFSSDIMYLADPDPGAGISNLVGVLMHKGSFLRSNLGGIALPKENITDETILPLNNRGIKKILVLPNKDLLIIPSKEDGIANSTFYIIRNPQPDYYHISDYDPDKFTASLLVMSPTINNIDGEASNILDCFNAGIDRNGNMRIAVVVSGDPMHEDLLEEHFSEKSLIRILHLSNKTLVDDGRTAIIGQEIMSLKTSESSASYLSALTGIISGGIENITAPHWNPHFNCLYFGISTPKNKNVKLEGNSHSFVLMGRFNQDDQLICSNFSPRSNVNVCDAFCVSHINQFSVKDLMVFKSAKNGLHYLASIIDHAVGAADAQDLRTGHSAKSVYCVPLVDQCDPKHPDFGKLAYETHNILDRTKATLSSRSSRINTIAHIAQTEPVPCARALVGGSYFPGDARDMGNIQFAGNSIMIVNKGSHLGGLRTEESKKLLGSVGAWVSNPIYDEAGEIVGWSQWSRAFASNWSDQAKVLPDTSEDMWTQQNVNKEILPIVKHAFESRGNLYFVTGNLDGSIINRIGFANWNSMKNIKNAKPSYSLGSRELCNLLDTDYTKIGIWFAKSFPSSTVGLGSCGLTVFSATQKLTIASTGGLVSANNTEGNNYSVDLKTLSPLDNAAIAYSDEDFSEPLQNVKHYKTFDNIGEIGNVLCAEVIRQTGPNNGFIFAGGSKGLAVLCKHDGGGFNSETTSKDLENLKTTFASMQFIKLPKLNEAILELFSTDQYLYILTAKTLYRMVINNNSKFNANMKIKLVSPLVDLSQVKNNDAIIMQIVKVADNDECFSSMTGIVETGVLFFASNSINSTLSSNIYAIKNGNNPMVEGNDELRNIFLTNTTEPDASSNFKYTLPFFFRKMFIQNINTLNKSLAINNCFAGPDNGVIANLYVISGGMYDEESEIYNYAIYGNKQFNTITLNAKTNWISSSPIPTLSKDRNQKTYSQKSISVGNLANGIDLTGIPNIYSSSSEGLEVNSFAILNHQQPLIRKETLAGNNSKIFGSVRLESGAQLLIGFPFGVTTYE